MIDNQLYEEVIEYKHLKDEVSRYEKMENVKSVTINKGYYYVTEIGKMFIKACCRE